MDRFSIAAMIFSSLLIEDRLAWTVDCESFGSSDEELVDKAVRLAGLLEAKVAKANEDPDCLEETAPQINHHFHDGDI